MAHLTARSLSPPQPSPSPTTSTPNGLPPHKRPRLSPNPPSPYGLNPSASNGLTSNISLPGSGFNFSGATSMPTQGAGAMGPPSKPVEKATDTTELADVLVSSGIDLKDEESFLTSSYSTTNRQPNSVPFNSAQSSQSTPGTLSANNSFNNSTSFGPAGEGIFAIAGSLSGPPAPSISVDELAKQEANKALKAHLERRSQHLNYPFLQSKVLFSRTHRISYENSIQPPAGDVLPQPQPHYTQNAITGSDGSKIVAVTGGVVPADSPISEVLALLSLAAEERIRGLVEDAVTLAKGRREGSDGVVPSEWSDLAVKLDPETPATNTRAGWESAVSPRTNPLKRPLSASNDRALNTQPGSSTAITYPNEVAKALREIAKKEQEAEDSWLARRTTKLQKASNSADGSVAGSVGPSTPVPGTPLLGDRAPDIDPNKKTTLKEQRKAQASKLDEFSQHRSANSTANMMLGSGGLFGKGKKKQYAWMTQPGVGSSPGTPRASSAVTGSPGFEGPGTNSGGGPWKRLGTWKESSDQGAGVQIRDWISALEADGREKKALAKAYARLRNK